MTADKKAAIDQWTRAHADLRGVLDSIEHASYTDKIIWETASKMLTVANLMILVMLK